MRMKRTSASEPGPDNCAKAALGAMAVQATPAMKERRLAMMSGDAQFW
jgi:hypothetical protein